jgi:hypothetical protein
MPVHTTLWELPKAEQFVTRNWIRNSPGNETRNEIIYETVPFLCLAQFVVLGISDTKLGYETGNFAAPNVAMTSVSVSDDAGGDDCRLTPFMQVYPPLGWMHSLTATFLCVVRSIQRLMLMQALSNQRVLVCRAAFLATDIRAVVRLPSCKASINTLKTPWT